MESFIDRHASKVIGALSGFDRVRLRGTLRWLSNVRGMIGYLSAMSVLLKNFKRFAQGFTAQIRQRAVEDARQAGRPVIYLNSSQQSKEQMAREIAQRDKIREGLICVFRCVEPCYSFSVGPNRETQRLELRYGPSKCLHQYHYLLDPQLGFLNVRLQTWFPFTIHVCLNGREWLARQMDDVGLRYVQRDNCFVRLADPAHAQRLMDAQLRVGWRSVLDRLTKQVHPLHRQLFKEPIHSYYWSINESEWATDVMFRSPEMLEELYPRLIHHGIVALGSRDVMRFLGHHVPAHGGINGNFAGEVVSNLRARPEGLRLKHRAGANSLKMYDKQQTVLRIETTLNDAGPLKVYRTAEKKPSRSKPAKPPVKKWRPLRKAVADTARRAKLCQAANNRYLDMLAKVEDTTPLGKLTERICRPTMLNGKRIRALNPLGEQDAQLIGLVCRGEFAVQGFRNADLRPLLFGEGQTTPAETRKQSAAVYRRLRLLRAHGLIQKIPKTHRYRLTEFGKTSLIAIKHAQQANTAQLLTLAA